MSVFLKNDCSYENCHKTFTTLSQLIIHIEQEHIDFDPIRMQQIEDEKPECVPMSYIQKFSKSDDPAPLSIKEEAIFEPTTDPVIPQDIPLVYDMGKFYATQFSQGEFNNKVEKRVNPIKTNDLKLKEEFSFDLLAQMNNKLFTQDNNHKKPFACNMPGCQKRYKNINGIKYHYKNYHKFDGFTFSSTNCTKRVKRYSPPRVPAAVPPVSISKFNEFQEISMINYHNHSLRFDEQLAGPPVDFYRYAPFIPPNLVEYPVRNQSIQHNFAFNYYNNVGNDGDFSHFSCKSRGMLRFEEEA